MSDPLRGEVWWVDLGIAGKVRPMVVVSAPRACPLHDVAQPSRLWGQRASPPVVAAAGGTPTGPTSGTHVLHHAAVTPVHRLMIRSLRSLRQFPTRLRITHLNTHWSCVLPG